MKILKHITGGPITVFIVGYALAKVHKNYGAELFWWILLVVLFLIAISFALVIVIKKWENRTIVDDFRSHRFAAGGAVRVGGGPIFANINEHETQQTTSTPLVPPTMTYSGILTDLDAGVDPFAKIEEEKLEEEIEIPAVRKIRN